MPNGGRDSNISSIAEESKEGQEEESKQNKISNSQEKYKIKDNVIPSFIYTSAHVRDLDNFKAMSFELATVDWKDMDLHDPAKYNGGGWMTLEELDIEVKMDDCDEMDDPNRNRSMVSRKKRK